MLLTRSTIKNLYRVPNIRKRFPEIDAVYKNLTQTTDLNNTNLISCKMSTVIYRRYPHDLHFLSYVFSIRIA